MNDNYLPDIFKMFIGGYMGDSYFVEWNENVLLYRKNEEEIEIKPDKQMWSKFWEEVNEINIWEWDRKYKPEERIVDGTSWKINIKYNDKEIVSSGSNAYPSNSEFTRFCDAVSELVGKREFK